LACESAMLSDILSVQLALVLGKASALVLGSSSEILLALLALVLGTESVRELPSSCLGSTGHVQNLPGTHICSWALIVRPSL
jgi:hypothetical protein